MAAQDRTGVAPATLRRAIAASALGNCVEWYDYAVYSYVVPIISVVFFPSDNPTAGIWLEFGTLTGYSIGATLVTVLTLLLPRPAMLAWGWRIPFLAALVLGVVRVYLRLRLDDTPVFKELEAKRQVSASPLGEVFRTALRPLALCIGIVLLLNVADYTLLTYMPTYLSQVMHTGDTASLFIIVFVQLAMMAVLPGVGALSDRIGRKPVLLTCALGFVVVSGPAFLLISRGQVLPASVGLLLLGLCLVLILGTEPATLPALFPAPTRYGGMAIGYNLSTSAFGGTAPLVITFLIASGAARSRARALARPWASPRGTSRPASAVPARSCTSPARSGRSPGSLPPGPSR
ncbi:MAG: MFS transporter [Candidatus Dormibacteraeota bacterium]|nr:MFS transporter [Candidatus Dormibacteraeota bacterium]MBO0760693.1 MFS transporter [Candidatus Dormibacteraeota bacterium]